MTRGGIVPLAARRVGIAADGAGRAGSLVFDFRQVMFGEECPILPLYQGATGPLRRPVFRAPNASALFVCRIA